MTTQAAPAPDALPPAPMAAFPTAPAPSRRPTRRVAAIALVATTLALALVPFLLPPWTMGLVVVRVGATEYGPAVALAAALAGTLALFLVRRDRAGVAVVAAMVAATVGLALLPAAGAAGAARAAAERVAAIPSTGDATRPRLGLGRPAPVRLADAFRGLPRRASVVERPVGLTAADGSPLGLRLWSDTAAAARRLGPRPVVVVVYGGAWQGGTPSQGAAASRYVAGLGYHVLAVAYRHAPQHRHPAAVDDVRRALSLLRDSAAAWGADPDRVALWGRSAGAHLAMLTAWRTGDAAPPVAVRGVIDFYGPFDLTEGYVVRPSPDPVDVRAVLRAYLGGSPDAIPARYREASPSSYVRPGLPPTLLVYARGDHLVLPRFGRHAAAALGRAGNVVVHLELPWAEHGFDLVPAGPNGQAALFVVERFLARVLG